MADAEAALKSIRAGEMPAAQTRDPRSRLKGKPLQSEMLDFFGNSYLPDEAPVATVVVAVWAK